MLPRFAKQNNPLKAKSEVIAKVYSLNNIKNVSL
jgi:hypothetical protein